MKLAAAQQLTAALVSDAVLDAAFAWLCRQRRDWPANADVWSFRCNWLKFEKPRVQAALLSGRYRFEPLQLITKADGSEADLWSARDALVLKALALVLADALPISPRCTHIKGNGGAKATVRQVAAALATNRFVLRTDVKSYYASIDHLLLMDRLARWVRERNILNLLGHYLRRTAESGGWFWDIERGISLGCPLSPLIGAFFLDDLDRRLTATGLFYTRFMDDILVLAPTRWKLRRAIRVVNEVLGALGLEKHPDKTFIGHIERGFDFLGYAFSRGALRVAQQTLNNHASRLHRLYERRKTTPTWAVCLDAYVTRWMRWCRSGLGGIPNAVEDLSATPPEKRQAQHSQRG
jgi:RNA-directed DNA polymerase